MAVTRQQVAELYVATFNRAPDAAGLDYWVNTSGLTIEGIAKSFFDQTETQTLYPTGTTDTAFVTAIYTNLFARTPDAAGLAYWVAKLTANGTTPAEMTRDVMIEAMKNGATGTDATIIANKATVGLYVTDTLKLNVTNISLASVTADTATVDAAKATADTYVPKSFSLTTGTDTFTGSLASDTITADILTLGSSDSVVDSSTTDSDVMNITLNNNVASTTTIKNIETLNVTALGAIIVDMTKVTGVNAFNTTGSTGAITINNASKNMALGFSGSTTNDINATFTADALSGTADKLVVNLNSAKAVSAVVNAGFESATVNATGTGNVLSTFTAPGVTSLTIAGTGDLTVGTMTGVTDVLVTDTAAVKFGALSGMKSVTATANTTGITGSTAVTAAAPYSSNTITGASTGLAVLLGSGTDNINVLDASASGKSTTVKLGAGNDLLSLSKGAAGSVYAFGEAGDDSIKITGTNVLATTDYIDGGEGTDTLVLAAAVANVLTLNSIENITLTGTGAGAATTINTNSGALAVTAKLTEGAADAVNVAGLTAGSTVTTAAATAGTAFIAGAVTVKFAATEAASTLNIAGGMTGALTTDKITNVTANLGAASDIATNYSFTAATDVTINATGALSTTTGQNVVDAALKNFTATGSDLVKFGTITSTVMENVSVTAAKALTVGNIGADSTKLDSVTLTATAGALALGTIGATTNTNTLDVAITAKDDITVTGGAIESTKIGNITETSTAGALTVGAIGSTATTIGDITLSAKNDVTVGLIGNTTEVATSVGTISMTSTDGKVQFAGINTKDAGGITVNLSAKTTIDENGNLSAGTAPVVENVGGNVTATLAGAAGAQVDFLGKVVTLTASNTGGLTSTITNAATAGDASVSSITLGNAASGKVNAITLAGTVDTYNVTGGTGNDTVAFTSGVDAIKNGTFSLGAGSADAIDFTQLNIANSKGLAMNFSSSTVTFGEGSANVTTLASGQVAAYDAANFAGSATAANKAIIADGQHFTVSGVETVIGSTVADYIALSNTGMTVTAGLGADKIIAGAGVDTIKFTATAAETQEGVVASLATMTGDVIYGLGNGDKIDLSTVASLVAADGAISIGTTYSAGSANEILLISGSYNTTTGVFTSGAASASNNDYILQFNGGTSTTTVNSTVFVDIVGTLTVASASEVLTLTVA